MAGEGIFKKVGLKLCWIAKRHRAKLKHVLWLGDLKASLIHTEKLIYKVPSNAHIVTYLLLLTLRGQIILLWIVTRHSINFSEHGIWWQREKWNFYLIQHGAKFLGTSNLLNSGQFQMKNVFWLMLCRDERCGSFYKNFFEYLCEGETVASSTIFSYMMSLEYMETDMAHFTLDQIWHDVNCWDAGSCKYMNTELETANAFFSLLYSLI